MPTTLDLLKHKAQPEAAAHDVSAWVAGEREMRSRLASEKEARDMRDKIIVRYTFTVSLLFL